MPVLSGIAALLIAAWCFDDKLSLSGDNAEFIILARSLAQGEGLSYVNDNNIRPATKYPFGLPLLLAPAAWLWGPDSQTAAAAGAEPVQDFIPMKWFVVLLFCGVAPVAYLLTRDQLDPLAAAAVAALCASQPLLVDYGHQVMSEIPYTLFSLLALFLVQRGARDRDGLTNAWLSAGFACLMWSYYVRSAGIVLVAAVVAYLAVDRQYRRALVVAASSLLVALPWMVRNYLTGRGSVYITQFLQVNPYHPDRGYLDLAGLFSRLGDSLSAYLTFIMPTTLWPPLTRIDSAIHPVAVVIIAAAVYTSYLCVRHREHLLLWIYAAFFLGLMFLWPWQGDRFLLPVIPVLLFFFVRVAGDLLGRLRQLAGAPTAAVVGVAALGLVLAGHASGLQRQARDARGPYEPLGWQRYYEAGLWIRNNLPADTVISCRKGFWMHVVSGRPAVGYPFKEPDVVLADMESKGVDVVVVDQLGFASTPRNLVPAIQKHIDRFPVIWHQKTPDTYVLRLLPASQSAQ